MADLAREVPPFRAFGASFRGGGLAAWPMSYDAAMNADMAAHEIMSKLQAAWLVGDGDAFASGFTNVRRPPNRSPCGSPHLGCRVVT